MANFTTTRPDVLEALLLRQDGWEDWYHPAFGLLLSGAMVMSQVLMWTGSAETWRGGKPFKFAEIPSGGPILTDDMLSRRDFLWTGINNMILAPCYFLHLMKYVRGSANISWSLWPNLAVLPQLLTTFFVYDAIYVPLHNLAHVPAIYPWVHKHHHRQSSPFRGMWDGLNVNPIEFLLGSYLHTLSLIIVIDFLSSSIGLTVHWSVPALFFAASSLFASMNHTRHDLRFCAPWFYDVRDHSVHHSWPRSNYGQFTMWWDRIYGTYMSFDHFQARKERGSLRRSKDAHSD